MTGISVGLIVSGDTEINSDTPVAGRLRRDKNET